MLKKKSIFLTMFINYLLIIITSFLLFMGVYFYLFHINLYKEYENMYAHQHNQLVQQLEMTEQLSWSYEETSTRLSQLFNQPSYHIYVVDEQGKQIFGPDPEKNNSVVSIATDVIDTINSDEVVTEGGFKDGELRYIVASKLNKNIKEADQSIMIMIFHNLTHEYKQVIWMIVITFMIAIIFAGVILWMMSKRIAAPLREMSVIARDYAKGDFSKTIKYDSDNEIGQLAKSFSYMAKELNHLEQRRRQYIANVSHELRSPLTSIKGFIIALMDGTIPENKRNHYYRLIKKESERMIKLVNDTLDMNQLEEGEQKLYRTNFNLTETVKQVIINFEPQLDENELTIQFHAEDDYYVFADQARIEQVIVNLLQNATQFTNKHSKIEISLIQEGKEVNIIIRDEGVGIEESELDLIWRRFYKTDESRTNKSGAGLGLAIVKSILDLHETEIKVESELGKGAAFSFSLPLSDASK